MKKIITLAVLFSCFSIYAQETAVEVKKDTTAKWKVQGFFGLNFSQTTLSDWQGGGQNNVALNTILNLDATYKRDKFEEWTNKLDAQYGLIKPGDLRYRKNIDQLFALSKYSLLAFKKYWFYSAQADYRTQFAPGYNYKKNDSIDGNATSDMNSPGYIQLALGLDYKPTDYFSVTFAPVAGKITIVNRQYLADEGAYGVEKAVRDSTGRVLTPGKRTRFEFGGRIIVKFKKDIFKNVNLDSYLDLFSNYMHNPGNIDVVFNNLLTIKINKYFSANVISQLLYDNDIIRKRDLNGNGIVEKDQGDINGPRLQALTTLAVGFGYKF